MAERGLLMSAPMVLALLKGAKQQTRRLVTTATSFVDGRRVGKKSWSQLNFDSSRVDKGPSPGGNPGPYLKVDSHDRETTHRIYPQWSPGDVLWIRETHAVDERGAVAYRADHPGHPGPWTSSLFMRRKHARILLLVTAVRPERLHDISEADAKAEGVDAMDAIKAKVPTARDVYRMLWDELNSGRAPWKANPWIHVLSFERLP